MGKKTSILGLKKSDANDALDDLAYKLFKSDGIPCSFDETMSITDANTYSDKNGYPEKVVIGIMDIAQQKGSLLFQPKIPDDMFVRVVLNMHHEKAHCIQKKELFRQEHLNSYEEKQLIQEIACMGCDDYYYDWYTGHGNYKINASEIQAEKEGILGAFEYLCDEFSDIDSKEHERMVLDIVNDKMMNSSYFVEQAEPFTSLQEVEAAFDDAYDNSFTENRVLVVDSHKEDPVKVFMDNHKEAKEVYRKASTAVEQDRCIAAIALKLHPEWLEQYPALKNMDLSYEHVIEDRYEELVNEGKAEPGKIYDRKYEEAKQRNFGNENAPVKVPEKEKHYDEKDLEGLSRAEKAEMMFGHLMEDSEQKSEYEKE